VFPQEVVRRGCWVDDAGNERGQCAKIWLSHSFLEQNRVQDVKYQVWCEYKVCAPINAEEKRYTGRVFIVRMPWMPLRA
jgi:hypothetical protein